MAASSANPLERSGRYSVAFAREYWYVACRSRELGSRPRATTLLGVPLVLFRDAERRPAALLDRCAHRNVPLSLGRTVGARIECGYHGWQYDRDGECRRVPALAGESETRGRRVPAYRAIERQGYVWIYASTAAAPRTEPFSFPYLDRSPYASVRFETSVEATAHAALENVLDVPHTAFLHGGLFRGGRQNEVTATLRRWHDRVEAEYVGEPRPAGLAGRLLAPRGGVVTHVDRFRLPSVAEVEYRLGERSHLVATTVATPVEDFVTRLFSVVSFRLPLPAPLVRLVVTPIARRIFAQDAEILRRQTDTVRRFGGEEYASTEVDLLGPHVWSLMKKAEEGSLAAPSDRPSFEKTVRLLV